MRTGGGVPVARLRNSVRKVSEELQEGGEDARRHRELCPGNQMNRRRRTTFVLDYKSSICTNTEQPTRAGSAITHIWWNWIFQSWVTQIDAAAAAVVHPPGPAALQAGYRRRLALTALTYFSSKFPVLNHGCTVLSYTHGHAGVSPAHLL